MNKGQLKEELRGLMSRKHSYAFYAKHLGIDKAKVVELIEELHQDDDQFQVHHDKKKEELKIKGTSSVEITDLDTFLKEGKVDLEKWQVKHFWQMYKKGRWHFSVFLVLRSLSQMNLDEVMARLKSVFSRLPKLLPLLPSSSNQLALVVYVSDEHVAAYVSEDDLYQNPWDEHIYRQRKTSVLEAIREKVLLYGPFKKIIICNLGDCLDGYQSMTTRGGHRLPQNMSDRKAFDTYLEVNKDWWDTLLASGFGFDYEFHCQTNDNHSGAFGYAVQRAIETYLNALYPSVVTAIYRKFIEHFTVGIHTVMLCHGKDEKNRLLNLPFQLNDRSTIFIKDYMDHHSIKADKKTVHFCKGDLHKEGMEHGRGFRYRNTLSLFGSSGWIMDNFGYNDAGCSMDIYDINRPHVLEDRVWL